MPNRPHFIFVVGPTATGKTELALDLAEKLNWPIINCDSVQVYKSVDIGTAKPTSEELQRAPHFLFDYVEPKEKLTVADYLADVSKVISDQSISNGIFVGGSGFYIQALEKGLYPDSTTSQDVKNDIQTWIDTEGFVALYAWIKDIDPEFASKISANDHYRIRRATEVMKSQDKTMTQLKSEMREFDRSPLPQHHCLKLGFVDERPALRPRVEARTKQMLQQGLVDEVRALREQGLAAWAPMQSVGYKEVQMYLDGVFLEKDLEQKIVTATMQLIKKQMTWFKRDNEIQWFKPGEISQASQWVMQSLKSTQA